MKYRKSLKQNHILPKKEKKIPEKQREKNITHY